MSCESRAVALHADAPPEVLQEQLQTFLRSLELTDATSAADDSRYREFVTEEPHQAVSHLDWASEYSRQAPQQHPASQSWHHQHQGETEQGAYQVAWHAAAQPSSPAAQVQQPSRQHPGLAWADPFHQPQTTGWAEDFIRNNEQAAAAQQASPLLPGQPWVSEFQAQQHQFHPANQPWADQFLAGTDLAWAEQFTEQQIQQHQLHTKPQLTPEEKKALKGPHPDDPLDDKAALTWVRQFNDEAAKPSVNFGDGIARL